MSGTTRNVSIRLSVEGEELVRRALQETGEQGQRALTTLDQATQRAAGQMVTLRTNTQEAARGGQNFSQVVGQAGFQIGDFASQVQAGGSALTAFSQQAGQFLGVFGTGGAIAGAALTVGILATQLLNTGNNAEEAKKGLENFAEATQRAARDAAELVNFLDRVSGRFVSITQRQRAVQLRELNTDVARLGGDANQALLDLAERQRIAAEARAEADGLRGRLDQANDPTITTGGALGLQDIRAIEAGIREAEGRAASAEADVDALNRRILRLDFERRRTEGLIQGLVADAQGDGNLGPAPETDRPSRGARGPDPAREQERLEASFARQEDRARAEAERVLRAAERTRNVGREAERASDFARELGLSFSSAFEDAIVKGESLRSVLQGLVSDISRIVIRQAVTRPLANAVGGLFDSLFLAAAGGAAAAAVPSANGNAFDAAGLIPFARGGVVNGPMVFPFASGIGLMGEAGPEAIMPLKRGRDGKLGVAAAGAGGPVVVNFAFNGSARDFGANSRQISGQLAAAVRRGMA